MRVFDSRKSLVFGALLLASTLAIHAAVAKGTPTVKDVAISLGGDSLEARITTTGPARFTYFELAAPRRLVVDFRDLLNGVGFREKQVSAGGVERIRAAVFHSKDRDATRIVFDLQNDARYQVFDDKTDLVRVLFGNSGALLPAVNPLQPEIRPLQPSRTDTSAVSLSAQLTAQDLQSPRRVAAAPSGSVLMLAAAMPAGQSQVNVAPPSTPGSNLSARSAAQYSGEIVDFDVRDLELKDFFRLISDTSGLNVVLDPNVSGSIPLLRMTDVPWDQALDVVLKQNGLSGQLDGNVLRIATSGTLAAEDAARKAQIDAKDATSPLETHTYMLNYTKVDAVAANLTTSLSKRGEVVRDARKNALIVTDIPTQFSKIDQLVKFMDTPAQQVEIEGRLLSANKSFSRDIGSQIGLLIGNRTGNVLTGGAGQNSPLVINNGATPRVGAGTGIPLLTNLPAAATSGVAFLLQPGGDILLDSILTAAEANGQAKLLSAPRITTQNNQAASVSQGTQIPVQTSVNNTVSTTFINFALKLDITPQITAAGTILLTVNLENSVPDFARAVNGVPSVATQKATTQVLIPDGGTAVIGGIYVDTDSLNVRQVPGLGSLPIIGHLFKETSTIKSTSELIFFVTPKIKSMDQIIAAVPDPKAEPQK